MSRTKNYQFAPELQTLLDNLNPNTREWRAISDDEYLQILGKLFELLPVIRQEFKDLYEELETKAYSKLTSGLKMQVTAERQYDAFLTLKELRELLVVNIENLNYLIKMIEIFKADAQSYFDNEDFCYSVKYHIWSSAVQFRYAYTRLYEYLPN